jgi:hypothetical protein
MQKMAHYVIDLTGDYRTTVYAAARSLLKAGAEYDDTLETVRGGRRSMQGIVGQAAAHKRPLCAVTTLRVLEAERSPPASR